MRQELLRLGHGLVSVAVAGVMVLSTGAPAVAAPATSGPRAGATTVATFGPRNGGVFAESLVAGPGGALYASVNLWGQGRGQLYQVGTGGSKRPFGPSIDIGDCALLTGLAVDRVGRLLVGEANFCGDPSRVYWVTPSAVIPWVTLPAGTFVNGLTVHGAYLYASESYGGGIYRAPLLRTSTQTTPWYQDSRLAAGEGLGANGIAFLDDALYVAVSETGTIWRLPLVAGDPGALTAFAQDPSLVTVDGIGADGHGGLWAAVNGQLVGTSLVGQAVIDVADDGTLGTAVVDADWMNYPTQPVLMGDTLYVENGAYDGGAASIVALPVS